MLIIERKNSYIYKLILLKPEIRNSLKSETDFLDLICFFRMNFGRMAMIEAVVII